MSRNVAKYSHKKTSGPGELLSVVWHKAKNGAKNRCRCGVVFGPSWGLFWLPFGAPWAPKSAQVRPKRPQDRLMTGPDDHFWHKT